jgi:hypothetical protein
VFPILVIFMATASFVYTITSFTLKEEAVDASTNLHCVSPRKLLPTSVPCENFIVFTYLFTDLAMTFLEPPVTGFSHGSSYFKQVWNLKWTKYKMDTFSSE